MSKLYTEGNYTISYKYIKKKKRIIEESIADAAPHEIDILSFKKFVANILQQYGKISLKNVDKYTSADNLRELMIACTHWSYDIDDNYEYYEILGDNTLNSVIVWYYVRTFPELEKMDKDKSVYLMTKLKIKGIQKQQFADFCDTIGLSDFIRYKELHYVEAGKNIEKTIIKDHSMKEDVFEAFFGCLNTIVNKEENQQVGYVLISEIINNFLDSVEMDKKLTLEPKKLEEGISMLKEIFDVLVKINPNNKTEFKLVEQQSSDPRRMSQRYQLRLKLYLRSQNFQLIEKTFEDEGLKKITVEEMLSHKALEWLERNFGMKWDYKNIFVPQNA